MIPGSSAAQFHNDGVKLIADGRWNDAVDALQRALELEPDLGYVREHLAFALENGERFFEALEQYQLALRVSERPARILRRLAAVHTRFGRIARAVEQLQQARELSPRSADILSDLAHSLCSLGEVSAAVDIFQAAVEREPGNAAIWGRMLLTAMYLPSLSPGQISDLHLRAATAISASAGETIVAQQMRPRRSTPAARLRVGYLSPDFHAHSTMTQVEPILRLQDRTGFDVTCYSDTRRNDETTARLQSYGHRWIETQSLTDEALAALIRSHDIEILVDLAGHVGQGRVRLLAMRPAPVQVSAFGYPNTTGLRAVDYRVADSFTDPPGLTEHLHTEELLRIDPCFFCYRPAAEIEICEPSQPETEAFVFCSFNSLPKISNPVMDAWASILNRMPGALLLLKALEFAEPQARSRLAAKFEARGVPAERVRMLPPVADRSAHLALYNGADLALDPFPYSGAITSCEALWMGVPVVSFAGNAHVGRVTGSILNSMGQHQWIANSTAEYIEIALRAAGKGKRHVSERIALREAMRQSPLMAQREYVQKFESLLKSIA